MPSSGKKNSLVFVCKGCADSGNYQTATRIASLLHCLLPDLEVTFGAQQVTCPFVGKRVVCGIHLRRTAEALQDTLGVTGRTAATQLICICGGTDINEEANKPKMRRLMDWTVQRSACLVVLNTTMKDRLIDVWPEAEHKVVCIPQSVELPSIAGSLSVPHTLWRERNYFLWIGRLRPVKDPNLALRFFTQWHKEHAADENGQKCQLYFIGSLEEDDVETEIFLQGVKEAKAIVRHIESVPRAELHQFLLRSKGLINTSRSEGQCLTIMEAFMLLKPVLARNSPGNTDLVQHGETGFLFSDFQEFSTALDTILHDETAVRLVVEKARSTINSSAYSAHNEGKHYAKIISDLFINDL